MNMIRSKPRSLVSPEVSRTIDEIYDLKVRQHSRPVEIEIPLPSVARFVGIAILLGVALLIMWPNPA